MKRRGQALVEIALVAPVMLTMLAITMEFGWYFYQMYYLNTAVRLAARVGAAQTTANNDKVRECVTQVGGPIVAALNGPAVVTVRNPAAMGSTIADTVRTSGFIVTVEANAVYWPFTRLVDLRNFGMPSQMKASSTFMIR